VTFWYTDPHYLYGMMLNSVEEGKMPVAIILTGRVAWYEYEVAPEAHTEGIEVEEFLECMVSSRAHAESADDD
jgi:hypothetical protein